MRKIFLAIRIPIDPLSEVMIKELHRNFNFMDVRWIEPKYLHMTLKFFGPTNEKRIHKISESLQELFNDQKSIELTISKLAMFGSRGAPKVLWLGINEESQMKDFAKSIQENLDKIGLYADRQNFVPHISLGRIIKTNSSSFFQKQMKKYKIIELSSLMINEIVLLESIITNKGVDYKLISSFKLG
ncbi:MAG: RNA 2',3'-cyclic phosphodiesterase [Bacteroidetes bacterium]|nr:MAG: RNA 2',3'-cyclic phosphodiesterase [Bacteroidota bacterium]